MLKQDFINLFLVMDLRNVVGDARKLIFRTFDILIFYYIFIDFYFRIGKTKERVMKLSH